MRHFILALVLAQILCAPAPAQTTSCNHAYLVEGSSPAAFDGINTTEPGFTSYAWAWGDNPSDQGTESVGLVDDGTGIAISPGLLWANSDSCSGIIGGTALLVETQTADQGGKLAVVVISGAEAQVDQLQTSDERSVAQPLPVPVVDGFSTGSDGLGAYTDVVLSWSAPSSTAWQVSDTAPIVAGFALYFITAANGGPVNTGDRSQLTRLGTGAGTAPYIVDDQDSQDGLLSASQESCTARIRPDGDTYYFAVSLILDGTGAVAGDPQADPSAVETTYVGASSVGINASDLIFGDGFESSDMSMWSGTSR